MGALFLARAFGPMRMFGMGVDGVVMMVVVVVIMVVMIIPVAMVVVMVIVMVGAHFQPASACAEAVA